MKHVASLTDALLAIGGSQPARKLMPLMGYRAQAPVTAFVRPLFPLKLLQRATAPGWKRLPRFARSVLWTLSAPTPTTDTWCARRITGEDALGIESVLAESRRGAGALERSAAQLRYMQECPIARIQLYAVEEKGGTRGYFMLAFVPGQARLIDAGMSCEDSKGWRALIQCAVAEARRAGNVAELTAWASDPQLSRWLAESGFHRRFNIPVWLRAGRAHGFSPEALRTQMLDSDAAYLHGNTGDLWA